MRNEYMPGALRCPKCGQDCNFQVTCTGTMTAYLDGSGDIEEADNTHPELSPGDSCMCTECLHVDSLTMFEICR